MPERPASGSATGPSLGRASHDGAARAVEWMPIAATGGHPKSASEDWARRRYSDAGYCSGGRCVVSLGGCRREARCCSQTTPCAATAGGSRTAKTCRRDLAKLGHEADALFCLSGRHRTLHPVNRVCRPAPSPRKTSTSIRPVLWLTHHWPAIDSAPPSRRAAHRSNHRGCGLSLLVFGLPRPRDNSPGSHPEMHP